MEIKINDLAKFIEKAVTSDKVLVAGAKTTTRAIPRRTRLGQGVKEGFPNPHKLPDLETKTIKNRERLKRKGQLTGPGATPKKSGLNRSGDMLNSVDYEVKNKEVTVKLGSTKEINKAIDLLRISGDYEFMYLSDAELKRVINSMLKVIEQDLKKLTIIKV